MAIVHNTTMSPGKLELLAAWLPAQPWFPGRGRRPELTRVGGFRLDDPQGEVGIEFMVVTDGSGDRPATYLVPLTYRGQELADAADGLIGTSEHGVLGQRWIYDGTRDPVLVAQLAALIRGEAEPQAQSASNTPDPRVTVQPAAGGSLDGQFTVRIRRILEPDAGGAPAGHAHLYGTWRRPDGSRARGVFATAWYSQVPAPPP
jgi:hypothetical protein